MVAILAAFAVLPTRVSHFSPPVNKTGICIAGSHNKILFSKAVALLPQFGVLWQSHSFGVANPLEIRSPGNSAWPDVLVCLRCELRLGLVRNAKSVALLP